MTKTTPEIREQMARAREWTTEIELLAQIKEEISILAAEHRRKKPIQVPRPEHMTRRRKKPVKVGEPNPEGFAHAIGVLKANARVVHYGNGTSPRR